MDKFPLCDSVDTRSALQAKNTLAEFINELNDSKNCIFISLNMFSICLIFKV